VAQSAIALAQIVLYRYWIFLASAMTQNPPPLSGATGGISIGGGVEGSALSTGNNNTQSVTYTNVAPPEVIEALRAIRAALEVLSGPNSAPAKLHAASAIEAAQINQVGQNQGGNGAGQRSHRRQRKPPSSPKSP
jgi:hypothetical protein